MSLQRGGRGGSSQGDEGQGTPMSLLRGGQGGGSSMSAGQEPSEDGGGDPSQEGSGKPGSSQASGQAGGSCEEPSEMLGSALPSLNLMAAIGVQQPAAEPAAAQRLPSGGDEDRPGGMVPATVPPFSWAGEEQLAEAGGSSEPLPHSPAGGNASDPLSGRCATLEPAAAPSDGGQHGQASAPDRAGGSGRRWPQLQQERRLGGAWASARQWSDDDDDSNGSFPSPLTQGALQHTSHEVSCTPPTGCCAL
jgi:hypothetical protein